MRAGAIRQALFDALSTHLVDDIELSLTLLSLTRTLAREKWDEGCWLLAGKWKTVICWMLATIVYPLFLGGLGTVMADPPIGVEESYSIAPDVLSYSAADHSVARPQQNICIAPIPISLDDFDDLSGDDKSPDEDDCPTDSRDNRPSHLARIGLFQTRDFDSIVLPVAFERSVRQLWLSDGGNKVESRQQCPPTGPPAKLTFRSQRLRVAS